MPFFPSTDIDYPADLPCPRMASNSATEGQSFLSSQLQRRQNNRRNRQFTASFVCESRLQMLDFETFYFTTLKDGTKLFLADWKIFNEGTKKEFRFMSALNVVFLGDDKFQVSASFQENTK